MRAHRQCGKHLKRPNRMCARITYQWNDSTTVAFAGVDVALGYAGLAVAFPGAALLVAFDRLEFVEGAAARVHH